MLGRCPGLPRTSLRSRLQYVSSTFPVAELCEPSCHFAALRVANHFSVSKIVCSNQSVCLGRRSPPALDRRPTHASDRLRAVARHYYVAPSLSAVLSELINLSSCHCAIVLSCESRRYLRSRRLPVVLSRVGESVASRARLRCRSVSACAPSCLRSPDARAIVNRLCKWHAYMCLVVPRGAVTLMWMSCRVISAHVAALLRPWHACKWHAYMCLVVPRGAVTLMWMSCRVISARADALPRPWHACGHAAPWYGRVCCAALLAPIRFEVK